MIENLNIGAILKEKRKQLNMSINDVVENLNSNGINISNKTIYSWETGYRQPDAETLLILCKIYKIRSFNEFIKIYDSDEKENLDEGVQLYKQLDDIDKAETRGVMKTLLKADKYQEGNQKNRSFCANHQNTYSGKAVAFGGAQMTNNLTKEQIREIIELTRQIEEEQDKS